MFKRTLNDIVGFSTALWKQWIPLVTGSGIAAGLGLWEHSYQRSVSGSIYVIILAGGMIVASFRAWRAERLEVARLKVRPYDDELRRIADVTLKRLSLVERDILRFLLLHGVVTGHVLNRAALISDALIAAMAGKLAREGLIVREEDHREGLVRYWVAENWREVFRDLLFARNEEQKTVLRDL